MLKVWMFYSLKVFQLNISLVCHRQLCVYPGFSIWVVQTSMLDLFYRLNPWSHPAQIISADQPQRGHQIDQKLQFSVCFRTPSTGNNITSITGPVTTIRPPNGTTRIRNSSPLKNYLIFKRNKRITKVLIENRIIITSGWSFPIRLRSKSPTQLLPNSTGKW